MNPIIVKSLAAGVLAMLLAGGLTSCAAYYRAPSEGYAVAYRWYPYDYFYYPSVGVYFHIYSGDYWYRDRGHWVRVKHLPPHIVVLARDRVRIRVDEGAPWRYHQRHVERYQPRVVPRPDPRQPQILERNRVEREHNRRLYEEQRSRIDRRPQRR